MPQQRVSSWRTMTRVVSCLAFGVLSAAVAGTFVVLTVLPRLIDGAALNVLTGSMTPEVPVGSVVLLRPVDPNSLRVGDVATYQVAPDSKALITHRVLAIDENRGKPQFTFKGDANRGPDSRPVPAAAIRGKVWFHVPYLGSLRDGLGGRGGLTLAAALLLAGYAVSQIGAGLRERKEPGPRRRLELAVNRSLIVATLDVERLASRTAMSPAAAARSWGAVLVHEDDDTCTIVLSPGVDAVGAALDLLHDVHPREVCVVDQPGTLVGPEARTLTRAAHEDDHVGR